MAAALGIILTQSNISIANLNQAFGVLNIVNGGTGLTTLGGPNQVLGVNAAGTALEYKTLTAGSNVTITYPVAGEVLISSTGGGGSGTVTSVGFADGSATPIFSVSGTPVTITGTLVNTLLTQPANLVFAGPTSGSNAQPTFRALTAADLPSAFTLKLYTENPVAQTTPTATGVNSIAILSASSAIAQDSLAIGVQSISRIRGGIVHASGRFASSGDAQTGRYILRNITTGAIPMQLFVDGVGGSIIPTLLDNSTWTFKVLVTGHRTDTLGGHAGYEFAGVIYRDAGVASVTILGLVSKTIIAESNAPWDANVTADITNGGINVSVTGELGKQIRWLALVETVEITN